MFEIRSEDGLARAGVLDNGKMKIKTPFFMPVATKGSVKFLDFAGLEEIGTDCIISNSFLLSLKPGTAAIAQAGGLHKYYSWNKGIFTDSGGFQSLDGFFLQKSAEEGAFFRSPFDGKTALLTPEDAMRIQLELGCDVAMCLDDVPQYDEDMQGIRSRTLRTHSWAKRCKKEHDRLKVDDPEKRQLLFGIVQGGTDPGLRKKSAQFISTLGFDGVAIGGLAIGEPRDVMQKMVDASVPHLPKDRPRYLMGLGRPLEILDCIAKGIDCFDSTFPTKNARHGTLFTWDGDLRINQARYAKDLSPIDKRCGCPVCRRYSRSYVHHQLKLNEPTGKRLATFHNLWFMQRLMEKARDAIQNQSFKAFLERFRKDQSSKS